MFSFLWSLRDDACVGSGVRCATFLNRMGSKKRRLGATETFSVSTDHATKAALKALAEERHGGNVSELITELAREAVRNAASDRLWAWGGRKEMTVEERSAFWADVQAGWTRGAMRGRRAPTLIAGRADPISDGVSPW
jgi:hypothetical protein